MVKTLRTGFLWLILATSLATLCGCETLGYYRQAVSGHLALLNGSKAIQRYLDSPETPADLKSQLSKVIELRRFAEQELLLPVNKQYSRYVSLERKYVVWNIFATPELSLEAKHWCYPVIGCAGYRGYYKEDAARRHADKLQAGGYDVYVAGVAAYSTLGWFKDPVLSSFIYRSDAELANLLFHELAHQLLYVKGDTVFNESFATVVAKEGVKRWMLKRNNPSAYQAFLGDQSKQQAFVDLVTAQRQKLELLYASELPDNEKRERKASMIAQLKENYRQLKMSWGGQSDYDHWFSKDINNAQLNTVATYFDLVPALTALLEERGGELGHFYKICRNLAAKSKVDRDKFLAQR